MKFDEKALLDRLAERQSVIDENLAVGVTAREEELVRALMAGTLEEHELAAAESLVAAGKLRRIEVTAEEAGEATHGYLPAVPTAVASGPLPGVVPE